MDILLIDNYDSFTYNLVHMLRADSNVTVTVKRNDQVTLEEVSRFSKIVLSPGPGIPCEAGLMPEIVRQFGATKTIFGVCLGHQCIGEIYGAKLKNIAAPIHGKATPIRRIVQDDPILTGLPDVIEVGRYHSWVVDRDGFPDQCLQVTAVDESGEIMALRHREHRVYGVQFHPESILTPCGAAMMENVIRL
ncbi:MAG: anthranilate synthase component II [Pseudomonadota bacterium]|jgi:anthranilate synthase component 2